MQDIVLFFTKYVKLSPSCITAAPPVGNSNACSLELFHTIAYFSSVSAEFNKPPVLLYALEIDQLEFPSSRF